MLSLLLAVSLAQAEAPLTGQLLDAETGAPVSGADVIAEVGGARFSAVSDADGRFALVVPDGSISLRALSPAHAPVALELDAAGAPLELLLPRAEAEGMVVLYFRDDDPVATRRTVSMEEIHKVPGSFGDPVRVITSLPGAARPAFGSSQLIIRGGNPDDTSVFVDGVQIPVIFHVGGYRSVIHPSMVADVGFLPGNFPVRYGGATGGVVDIQTRADFDEGWRSTLQVDLLDASVATRGALADGRIGVAGAVRRSYIDAVLAGLGDSAFLPRWFDYQVQVQTLGEGPHTIRLFVFGMDDQLGGEDSELGISTSTASHRGVMSWVYEPDDSFQLLVQPAAGWDSDLAEGGTTFQLEEEGLRLGLRAEARWRPSAAWRLTGGLDASGSQSAVVANLPTDPNAESTSLDLAQALTEDADVTQASADPYLELQLRPLADPARLVLVGGLRGETWLRSDFAPIIEPAPRLSGRLQVTEGGLLKLGGGLYHQPPDSRSLTFSPDTAFGLERATTGEIGWEQRLGDAASVDLVGFYKHLDHLVQRETGAGFGMASFTSDGLGRAWGLELLARKDPVGPLFGWVSYAWTRSERLDDPEVSDGWVPFDYDQPHNLVVVAGYTLPRSWDLSTRFQYTSGNPYTPYEDAIFDLDTASYAGVASGDVNSARMDPYWALDVRVGKTWSRPGMDIEGYLNVLNLVHGENPEAIDYSYDFSESQAISSLPLVPAPGLELNARF